MDSNSTDTYAFADNCIYSSNPEETGLNNNILVNGSPGTGKTVSIVESRLLGLHHSGAIINVTKRRLVDKFRPLLESRGFKTYEINMVDPEKSDLGYDPMKRVKTDMDVLRLASAIVFADSKDNHNTADPYWDQTAISVIAGIIDLVRHRNRKPTMNDVLKTFKSLVLNTEDSLISTNLDSDFKRLELQFPDSLGPSCWKTFTNISVKTGSCIYSCVNNAIDKLFPPAIQKLMDMKPSLSTKKTAEEKSVIFVVTGPVAQSSSFINLFWADVLSGFNEYAENRPDGKLPHPIELICDDFAVSGIIDKFADYISIIREKRLSVILLIQSESQLSSMYSESDATTIINSCDTYIYMGGMDYQSCRNISVKMDVPMSDIMFMPVGEMVILRRGQRPIITKRLDLNQDAVYRKITDDYAKKIEEEYRISESKNTINKV